MTPEIRLLDKIFSPYMAEDKIMARIMSWQMNERDYSTVKSFS